ncbi:MAG: SGNH/GDSL hydrolase family protein [Bacteroidales bacterium]|nr:SGNH/GDSL hydrolase family protein [Bacteroidales bacterium]
MRYSLLVAALFLCTIASAQGGAALSFTEASELTITGKVFPETPNPYHRLDSAAYKGFTSHEIRLLQNSAGLAVAFVTDSPSITLCTEFGYKSYSLNSNAFMARGYDLYIRKDGQWLWAASGVPDDKTPGKPLKIINNLPEGEKECLLYLPGFSEVLSLKVGVPEGSGIRPLANPFRHRIAVFGSSFTQGAACSKSGMAWPSILSRETGLLFLNLGVSGRCKLQDYFAAALAAAPDVDAFVFDTFSNPTPKEVEDRLYPFIEAMKAAHPGKPLVFLQTIYRERGNFDTVNRKWDSDRVALVENMMKEACRKYEDVYFLTCTNATSSDHYTSVDGTHPGDYGYTLWARSIRKPLLKILKKYGIR